MKKILSLMLTAIVSAAVICLSSCNKGGQPSGSSDGIAGTTWSGQVIHKAAGQATITGQLSLEFEEGNKVYSSFYQEDGSYTLSSDKKTVSMKFSAGSCTLVISGDSGQLTGSDTDGNTYSGTLTKL